MASIINFVDFNTLILFKYFIINVSYGFLHVRKKILKGYLNPYIKDLSGFVRKSKHSLNRFKFTKSVEYLILILTVFARTLLVNSHTFSYKHFSGGHSLKKFKKSGKIMFTSESVTQDRDIIMT